MSSTPRHIIPLVTVAAALSIWTALIAAADSSVGGLRCRELTDTGKKRVVGNSGNAAPKFHPRRANRIWIPCTRYRANLRIGYLRR